MSRLQKAIDQFNLDNVFEAAGWHGMKNNHLRQVTYYRGNHYIRFNFSRFVYTMEHLEYWNPNKNKLFTWESKHDDNLFQIALVIMGSKTLKDINRG